MGAEGAGGVIGPCPSQGHRGNIDTAASGKSITSS